jgi:hypothetical protein
MNKKDESDLKNEIAHIFDSGANEIRIEEMIKNFIKKRYKAINYTRSCEELCDCEIPKPIDAYHPIDKNVCKDCNCNIA